MKINERKNYLRIFKPEDRNEANSRFIWNYNNLLIDRFLVLAHSLIFTCNQIGF